jgi:hypothetical protein
VCGLCNRKNVSTLRTLREAICYPLVARGRQTGATVDSRSQEFEFSAVADLDSEISCGRKPSSDDPIGELARCLLARIKKAVFNHETDDWPRDYDRLYAMICKVIAQSNLSAETKPLLTKHLIRCVAELEKSWPELKLSQTRVAAPRLAKRKAHASTAAGPTLGQQ